jgi:UDP-3-O-[3-hydroxymyristoyl] glucosamine N-acyltransferase
MLLEDYFASPLRKGEFECLGILHSRPEHKMLAFVENKKYAAAAKAHPCISAVICTAEIEPLFRDTEWGIVIAENPRISFFELHNRLCDDPLYSGETFWSRIGNGCNIHPMAVIAENNVVIGDCVTIEEFVSIKEGVYISSNCTIRAGSVIGGFSGEAKRTRERILPVRDIGRVILEEHIEIGQNSTVDRAVFPWHSTKIGKGSIIHNGVHLSHGVSIGKRVFMAPGSVICGSVQIGDDVWIGPGSIIKDRVSVGNNARISIGSVVLTKVKPDTTVIGDPAVDISLYLEDYRYRISRNISEK